MVEEGLPRAPPGIARVYVLASWNMFIVSDFSPSTAPIVRLAMFMTSSSAK